MKVNDTFKEVDLNWLLYGKGEFPSGTKTNTISTTPIDQQVSNPPATTNSKKSIDRIVIFYKDGTFKNFTES